MKKSIILDTDILNEMDDQFAIAYLIGYVKKMPEIYELKAVTIAPFNPGRYLKMSNYEEAMKLAKLEVEKIFKLSGFSCPIYIGSSKYLENQTNYNNEAVNNIIKIIKKSKDKVVIIAIGCATNIAMALREEPSIASKLEVVWLGGNGLGFEENDEFNFIQDVPAIKELLSSNIELTIVPARPVSSALNLTREVSERYILPCGQLGKYLHDLIVGFSKDRKGGGRKLWDIAPVYEFFNREEILNKSYKEAFKCPITYIVKNNVSIDENKNNRYVFDSNIKNKITFLNYIDSEVVIDDLINKIEFLTKKNDINRIFL
jgi:inosine-uridine nucleoside N-ribohydrolase